MTSPQAPGAIPVLEVGGSHVTAAAVDPDSGSGSGSGVGPDSGSGFGPDRAGVLDGTRQRLPLCPDTGAEDFLAALADVANRVLAAPALHGRTVGGTWGVAVPGPFDYATGTARYRDVGKFAALDGLPVAELLGPRLRCGPARLRFLNDAHAFGIGAWRGPGARGPRLVAVTLGTGVGSAFLDHGTPVVAGPSVPPEGRADLLAIGDRPLEDVVSTRALAARYTALTGTPVDGLRELSARAARGETVAQAVIDDALHALGAALAPWLSAFEADTLVVGGSATAAWDRLGPPFTAGLTARHPALAALRLAVRPDGEDLALLGAAEHAMRA